MTATRMDRRDFVATCAMTCAGLVLGGCVSMVTHPVPVMGGQLRLRLADFPELAAMEGDGAIRVQPAGREEAILILATANGGFTALSPICTHRGCTVDVSGARLVCPCHGSTYDRAGAVLRGPAERALASYPVRREGDLLIVEVGS